jgi:excisionase family DNA binding protein
MERSGDLIRAIDLESISSGANRLGITRQRLHQMIQEDKIDAYRFGNRLMLHKRDVDRLIARRQAKKAS